MLMVSRYASGVGARIVRSLSAASPLTRAVSEDGTPFHATALWSWPLSLITRFASASGSAPNFHTKLSGYWWRTGSVAGSQFVLRARSSSTPATFFVILYGPDENGWLSRLTPVSLSGGSGAVNGSEAANGRSQCGLL